jgi:hypothetical protein
MSRINKKVATKEKKSGAVSKITERHHIDYNERHGRLAFLNACDKHCLLSKWRNNELDELIGCFKKVERSTWKNILRDDGLKYESHQYIDFPRPKDLPPDASLDSIRVTQRMRLYGYRSDDVFYIIWFDREHAVCPMSKQKRYKIN